MDSQDIILKSYLEELYRQSGGDLETQVSMYDIGTAIGLDKAEAGSVAEQLMFQELAELKTLAGGIAITEAGLTDLGIAVTSSSPKEGGLRLSVEAVANDSDRQTVQQLTEQLKNDLSSLNLTYPQLEEIILDLKTIEVYMLSPRPKNGVLRELFRSLQEIFASAGANKTADLLQSVLD